jgi:hypothetical protein
VGEGVYVKIMRKGANKNGRSKSSLSYPDKKKQNKAFASSIYYNTEAIGGYVRKAHASRNGISSHSGSCAY